MFPQTIVVLILRITKEKGHLKFVEALNHMSTYLPTEDFRGPWKQVITRALRRQPQLGGLQYICIYIYIIYVSLYDPNHYWGGRASKRVTISLVAILLGPSKRYSPP